MNFLTPDIIDISILIFVTISSLFALGRGFIGEILTLCIWIGATLTTIYGWPILHPFLGESFGTGPWVSLAGGSVLFILSFLLYRMISTMIERMTQSDGFGFLNHLLGLFFGLLRGVLLICLGYFLLTQYVPVQQQPTYIIESKAFSIVLPISRHIATLAPEHFLAPFEQAPVNPNDPQMEESS